MRFVKACRETLLLILQVGLYGLLSLQFAGAAIIDSLPNVAKLPVIHVPIDPVNAGIGHQAAGAVIVQRLREMGYRGQIEISFDGRAFGLKEKIAILFPGYQINGDRRQVLNDTNIVLADQQTPPTDFQQLAIMGGADDIKFPVQFATKYLLLLQPMNWKMGSHYLAFNSDGYEMKRDHIEFVDLDHLKPKGYVFNVPAIENPQALLESEMAKVEGFSYKVPALKAVLSARNQVHIAPAYGHLARFGQVLRYGLALSQAARTSADFQKGIVVLAFNEPKNSFIESTDGKVSVESFEAKLSELFYERKLLGSFGTAKEAQLPPDIKDRLQVTTVDNQNLQLMIQRLHKGQVLVVDVGRVPKNIFEMFYKLSDVTPLVEGRNSMNLMNLIGRPYLPSDLGESFQDQWPSALDSVRKLAEAAVTEIKRNQTKTPVYDWTVVGENLVNYLRLAQSPRLKAVWKNAFHIDAQDLSKDKLYQGLLAVEMQLAARAGRQKQIIPMHPTTPISKDFCKAVFQLQAVKANMKAVRTWD